MNFCEQRSCHPSLSQVELLVDMMGRHPDFAKGYSRTQSARLRSQRFWERLQLQLNNMSDGTTKTWRQWMKYWSDKKSAVKKKAMLRAASRCRADGGGETVDISELEERIVAVMGWGELSTGESHFSIQVFQESLGPPDDGNILIPKIEVTEMQDNSIPTTDDPETGRVQSLSPEPHASPPRRPSTNTNTNPRRGRRFHSRASPSQRRIQFMSITERLLRVEERRMDVEQSNARLMRAVLERLTERDVMMAGALQALSEGLFALSESIKRDQC